MSKSDVSVPLQSMSTSDPDKEVKYRSSKKKCTNSFIFKLFFLIIISIFIVLLIAVLIVVILRPYQSSCAQVNSTTVRPTIPPKVRVLNDFWNEYYLPTSTTPIHYVLTLQLLNTTYDILKYNQTDRFYGLVNVRFRVNSPTNFVVLHAKNLIVQTISLKEISKSNQSLIDVKIQKNITDSFYDYLILVLNRKLKTGSEYVVEAKYSGVMSSNNTGIITTIYNDLSINKRSYLLYSKLEPIGARSVFPCFDAPDKKATFTVKIIHYATYQALSNMPLERTQSLNFSNLLFSESHWNNSGNFMISEFIPSEIKMSTYLLAFVVIDNYQNISKPRDKDKIVRVWAPTDLIMTAKQPLDYSVVIENFFVKHFNYSSPLPKTDHIYIPDFLSGAMENWGLITYRDKHLLISDKQTAFDHKSSLVTIAHELAHYWFGNWITVKTWGEIWLNEAFATFFASVAYYKNTKISENQSNEFSLYYRRHILMKDVKAQTTVITNVTDPRTYKSVFNDIVYYKGSALLVWLESMMGALDFHRGIKNYIYKFAGKNPTTTEFFKCMDEIKQEKNDLTRIKSLENYFKPWLYRGGFPVVTANYDLSNKNLILTQSSILFNSSSSEKWPIHMTYRVSSGVDDIPIYFNDTMTFNIDLGEKESVIFNSDGKSYLRVNYSELLWNRIIENLQSSNTKVSPVNKIVLFDDAFDFVEKNKFNISIVKGLIQTLVNETSPMPWLTFYKRIFEKLFSFFRDDPLFIKFSDFVRTLSTKILDETMNINADSDLNLIDDLTQRVIFTMNCDANNEKVLKFISRMFLSWIENPKSSKLPKHLVKIILFYGIRSNDKDYYWKKLWKMLITKDYGDLTFGQITIGLAGTTKTYYLHKLLDHFLIPNSHRNINEKKHDLESVIDMIMKSTGGVMVVQRWLTEKPEKIKKFAFGDNISLKDQTEYFESLLKKLCKSIYEPYMVEPLSKLQTTNLGLERLVVINRNLREQFGKRLIKIL